jgi:hypothetical protein
LLEARTADASIVTSAFLSNSRRHFFFGGASSEAGQRNNQEFFSLEGAGLAVSLKYRLAMLVER